MDPGIDISISIADMIRSVILMGIAYEKSEPGIWFRHGGQYLGDGSHRDGGRVSAVRHRNCAEPSEFSDAQVLDHDKKGNQRGGGIAGEIKGTDLIAH